MDLSGCPSGSSVLAPSQPEESGYKLEVAVFLSTDELCKIGSLLYEEAEYSDPVQLVAFMLFLLMHDFQMSHWRCGHGATVQLGIDHVIGFIWWNARS